MGERATSALDLRPGWLVAVAAVSLVSMPFTAVWSLVLAFAVFVASAAGAATRRDLDAREATLSTGLSVGLGLLVGPAVYLGLGALT